VPAILDELSRETNVAAADALLPDQLHFRFDAL
jgi:hypothetical protein